MEDRLERHGLQVSASLVGFIEAEVLAGLGMAADVLWRGIADLYARFTPDNRALLSARDTMQADLDAWHAARRGQPVDPDAYQAHLREIGYLVPEPAPFAITCAPRAAS